MNPNNSCRGDPPLRAFNLMDERSLQSKVKSNEFREAREKICEVFREKSSFLITSHKDPCGDAIGSELALGSLLRSHVIHFMEGC